MRAIKDWIEKQNIQLERQFDLPDTFPIVAGRKICEDDYNKLVQYTKSLASKDG